MSSITKRADQDADTLAAHIATLETLSTADAVDDLVDLAPGLTAKLSFAGHRTLTHKEFSQTGDLDHLTRLYLHLGSAIAHTDSTPLATRLQWADLWSTFDQLYKACDESRTQSGWLASSLRNVRDLSIGCPCCTGVPHAVISMGIREMEAFYFSLDEFRRIWPQGKSIGSRSDGNGTSKRLASRAMIEEAIARQREEKKVLDS